MRETYKIIALLTLWGTLLASWLPFTGLDIPRLESQFVLIMASLFLLDALGGQELVNRFVEPLSNIFTAFLTRKNGNHKK